MAAAADLHQDGMLFLLLQAFFRLFSSVEVPSKSLEELSVTGRHTHLAA